MHLRFTLISIAITTVVWFYASGTYATVDPERMRDWLQNAGAWGGLLFVLTYCVLQPLGARSVFFLLSAPMVWEPMAAFLLSWLGAVAASIVAFGFARFVAGAWAQRRLPRGIRRLDDRLATRGLRTVLLLRPLFYTAPMLQFALGVSRVRLGPFLGGTMLGVVPFTALVTFLGVEFNAWLTEHPIASWPWDRFGPQIIVLALALALVAAAFHFIRRWQGKLSFETAVGADPHLE